MFDYDDTLRPDSREIAREAAEDAANGVYVLIPAPRRDNPWEAIGTAYEDERPF